MLIRQLFVYYLKHMISSRDRLIIVVMMAAAFTSSFSQNLLASAIPAIIRDFNIDAVTGQWLTTAYILVMGAVTSIIAYLFAKTGARRLELSALALFATGCLGAFLAPTFPVLLSARLLQAAGAGVLTPLMQIILLHIFPQERQGQALSLTGIIVGFAPAVAPAAAGLLIDNYGWRSIFLTLFLLSVLSFIAGTFVLRDFAGSEQKRTGDNHVFLKTELLRERCVLTGTVSICITYAIMIASTILVPIYIQNISGHSATYSGMIMMPGSILIALFSIVSGKVTDKAGPRSVILSGMTVLAIGCIGFVFLDQSSSGVTAALLFMIRSIGLAFLITACSTLAVQSLPLGDKSYAMALLNSLRLLAGAVLPAGLVMTASFFSRGAETDMHGIHISFAVMTILAIAGLVLTMLLIPHNSRKEENFG